MELPFDSAVPLLGFYPKNPETLIQKNGKNFVKEFLNKIIKKRKKERKKETNKQTTSKMDRYPTVWENIFANDTSAKGLISKIQD